MKTDDLVEMLARNSGPVDAAPARRILLPGLLAGGLVALALAWAMLGLIAPDRWLASATGPKVLYAVVIATGGLALFRASGRPGMPVLPAVFMLCAFLGAALGAALFEFSRLPMADVGPWIMGTSAPQCPFVILGLSLPLLVATFAGMRQLAPTNLRLGGFAAGLVAGAVAALAYAMACGEGSLMFVALWYSLGMALAGGLGAALGPRVLRW